MPEISSLSLSLSLSLALSTEVQMEIRNLTFKLWYWTHKHAHTDRQIERKKYENIDRCIHAYVSTYTDTQIHRYSIDVEM